MTCLTRSLIGISALVGCSCWVLPGYADVEKAEVAKEATPAEASWSVLRGNPELQGVAETALPAPLTLAWSFAMKGPIVATAAISEGRVFLGSQDGDFHALELTTGKEIWTKTLGENIESSACVLDGRVYVGSGDGYLYALKADTGDELWKYKTDGEILGGVNYVKVDGKIRVIVGSYDNFLHCVDAETGEKVWAVETGNYINGAPAVAEGLILFGGCDAILYMVDAVTGEKKGQIEVGSYISNNVTVKDGVVYTAHYGNQVQAFSIADKKQLWVHEDRDFPYFASPAIVGDQVIAASRGKRVYNLNRKDGAVKWEYKSRRSVDSSPLVSGNLIYFGCDDGRVYAIDLATGEEKWFYEIGDALTASPAIAANRLVIGSQDGSVYVFEPSNN